MNEYLHKEIYLNEDDIVEVKLAQRANVMLLDPRNYESYRKDKNYTYFGGYATQSPVHLKAPHAGSWHVIIDLGGATGKIEYSVDILKKKN